MKKSVLIMGIIVTLGLAGCVEKIETPSAAVKAEPVAEVLATPEKPKVSYGPGLGIDYASMIRGFDEYIPRMTEAPLASGENRVTGRADESKAMAIVEVVGDLPTMVDRASLTFFAVSDKPILNLGNIEMVQIFMRNALPEWVDGGDQVLHAMVKMAKGKSKLGKSELSLVHGDKQIDILLVKQLAWFTISVRHRAA